MAEILVRDVDDALVERLRARAEKVGLSLEAEVRRIIEESACREPAEPPKVDKATALRLLDEFRARFKGRKFSDSVELIREDRDGR